MMGSGLRDLLRDACRNIFHRSSSVHPGNPRFLTGGWMNDTEEVLK